jgi:hypothetical protein
MEIYGDPVLTRTGSRVFRRRQLPPGLAVAAAFLLSACHLMGTPRTGPEGRSVHDSDLHRLARDQAFMEALDLTNPDDADDIGDELLRLMHRGLLLHYAGRYEESNEVLQQAEVIIDERYTKSVSRALLSMVTSDRALAWVPGDTERMMVNYYGALNYLALADPEEAAVEARRLSRLLELGEDDEIEAEERQMRRTLRYFAAAVFEATGNHNDAGVAYRHIWLPGESIPDSPLRPRFVDLYNVEMPEEEPAEAPLDFDAALDSIMAQLASDSIRTDGLGDLTDPASAPITDGTAEPDSLPTPEGPADPDGLTVPDSLLEPSFEIAGRGGDVVILLEHGFVAHRVERSSTVPVFPLEADAMHDPDNDIRFATASCVASRGFKDRYDFSETLSRSDADWRTDQDGQCLVPRARRLRSDSDDSEDADESEERFTTPFAMRVAWPEMISSGLPTDLSVLGLSIAANARPMQLASLDAGPETAPAIGVTADPDTGLLADAAPADETAPPTSDPASGAAPPVPTFAKPAMRASVSGAVTEEFEDQLGGIMIKMVARTALKYELARGLEKELDKKNETLGDIAFFTANAAAALFERADTRSWHLLPDEVSVVRLPPGVHPLSLQVETDDEGGTRLIDLGEVEVRDGSIHVLSARVWP